MLTHRAMQGCRQSILVGLGMACIAVLAACQPSPEERLQSAREYVTSGEYQAAILEVKNALRADPNNVEARVLLASASYQLADFATAADEYTRALELGADTHDNWIGLGRSLLRAGDAVGAFERVQPNLDESTDNPEVLVMLGDIYASLGNNDDARRVFDTALELDDASLGALIGLAAVTAAEGDRAGAIQRLQQAAATDPAASQPWAVMGNYALLSGDLEAATSAYGKAIERHGPHTPLADRFDVHASLVQAAIESDDLGAASDGIDSLAAIFPQHPTLNFLRGRLAFASGDMQKAEEQMQRYMVRVPNDMRSHAVMGAISFSKERYAQAEMYLQQAVRGNIGGEVTRRLLAETQLRLNRPEEALEILRGVSVAETSDASLLSLLGRAEFGAGNTSSGLQYLEQGVAASPDDPGFGLVYALGLLSDGQNDLAIDVLENVPDGVDTMHRREMLLIAAHQQNDDQDSAVAVARDLVARNPEDPSAHALTGAFMYGIGDRSEAEARYTRALELQSDNEVALFGIASIARDRGDTAAAEASLTTLLDTTPAYMPALSMLGQLLLMDERPGEFEPRVDAAIEALPGAPGPRILKIRSALAAGDDDRALQLIRTSRELFPDSHELEHLEGFTLIRLGQSESALLSLSRAAADAPNNPRYQFDLAVASLQARDYYGARDAITAYRALREDDAVGLSVQVNTLIGLEDYDAARAAIDGFAVTDANAALVSVLRGDVALAKGAAAEAATHFEAASESLWDRGIALRLSSAYLESGSDKAPEPLARWLEDHPDDAVVRRSYGQLLQSGGDPSGAIAEYERVLAENADDPIALNNLAWEYAVQGRAEAVELARRAYELEPEVGSIADTYGWILYKNGRADEAASLLRRAASLSPDNGEIHFHLARVLAETGQRDEARRILTTLLDSGQSFPSRQDAMELVETL